MNDQIQFLCQMNFKLILLVIIYSIIQANSNLPLIMKKNKSFKIIQFTDLHFGAGYAIKDFKNVRIIYRLLSYIKPDFVALTGDILDYKCG